MSPLLSDHRDLEPDISTHVQIRTTLKSCFPQNKKKRKFLKIVFPIEGKPKKNNVNFLRELGYTVYDVEEQLEFHLDVYHKYFTGNGTVSCIYWYVY